MDFVALRKLVVGVLILLLASGVIKWEPVKKHLWLRVLLYGAGILLIIFAALYQFDVIPESRSDAIFK
jgi:predicted acyltransferase